MQFSHDALHHFYFRTWPGGGNQLRNLLVSREVGGEQPTWCFSQRFSIHFPREIHENPGGFGDLKVVLIEMERIITSNFKPTLFSSELLVAGNASVTTILNIVEKNPLPCMGIPFASKIFARSYCYFRHICRFLTEVPPSGVNIGSWRAQWLKKRPNPQGLDAEKQQLSEKPPNGGFVVLVLYWNPSQMPLLQV